MYIIIDEKQWFGNNSQDILYLLKYVKEVGDEHGAYLCVASGYVDDEGRGDLHALQKFHPMNALGARRIFKVRSESYKASQKEAAYIKKTSPAYKVHNLKPIQLRRVPQPVRVAGSYAYV